MSTRSSLAALTEEIRKLSATKRREETSTLIRQSATQLNALLGTGPVVVAIYSHLSGNYEFISANIEPLLGIRPQDVLAMGQQAFLARYAHPDDLEIVATRLFPAVVHFITQQPKEAISRYSIHYNYRLKGAAGTYITIEQQTSPLQVDAEGRILLEQNFCTQVGECAGREAYPIKLLISYRTSSGAYTPCFSQIYLPRKPRAESLTRRELEILTLLAAGKTSSAIAASLHISETTIMTHRRNMLQKLGLKNTSELISWAFHAGLLS
ncbi:LuxR C-terminal-related transcriptional regulator [Cesiribacter andamanensis]|uniref:CsgBAC operon transcriptional regulatory protein n=1 Tax=Cesiribacter andamanensis AMV16 TaxID=1279009 RepID=M7NSZ1_9BACT|nr:LuxR C-terminal-related transcriptional regulator [Cesiribacter andamanensis]EMR04780.1 CsgBAC operon transcriptional regulatory protein [Cesiribacter andamanensis AMV16]